MSGRFIKKEILRRLMIFLTVFSFLAGLVQTVEADAYEPGRKGSFILTLKETMQNGDEKVFPGVKLKLYKVGSIPADGTASFVLDPSLASSGVNLGNLTTARTVRNAAEKLGSVVGNTSLPALETVTDSNGLAVFSDLEQGMYLILQGDTKSDIEVSRMLLSIPYLEESGNYLYDVQVYPKVAGKVTSKPVKTPGASGGSSSGNSRNSSSPVKTGDETNITFYVLLLFTAAALVAVTAMRRKKR